MKMFLLFLSLIIIIIMGIIVIIGVPGYKETIISSGYEGEFIELKGDKIRYIQKGKGPDILFIHTLHGIAEDWEFLAAELENEYRVTYFDRPGQGFSTFQPGSHPLGYNVEIITGLIKALSLRDVIIVGQSYGGSIALALAVQDIPEARGYVLINPLSFPRGGFRLFSTIIGTPIIGRGLIRAVKGFYLPTVINSELANAFNPETIPENYYNTRIDLFYQTKAIVSSSIEKMHLNREIKLIADYYSDIQKPILIIHGKNDKINDLSMSRDLGNILPNSTFVEFKEIGHMIQYLYPKNQDEDSYPVKIKAEIDAFVRPPESSENDDQQD